MNVIAYPIKEVMANAAYHGVMPSHLKLLSGFFGALHQNNFLPQIAEIDFG